MSSATQGSDTGAAANSAAGASAAGSNSSTAGASGSKASGSTAGASGAATSAGAAGSGNGNSGQAAAGTGTAGASGGSAATAGAGAGPGGSGAAAADGGGGTGTAAGGSGATAGGSAGAASGSAGTAAADGGGRMPDPKFIVPATGPCPEFRDGYVMFMPDGKQRRVLLYTSGAMPDKHGPLLFSWHSTLPNPENAVSWIGQSVINEIKAQGGVVAAPATGYPGETRPWDNTPMGAQNVDGDQRLMDEVVACAIMKLNIDVRRIHATGMSAGGLKTSDVSLRRSGYLASVVVYSGGFVEGQMPPDQDPTNPVNAMIFYGGPTDISPVDGINYTQASNRYLDVMRMRGGFAFLCNHGGGHSVPQDSQAGAWKFLQDHPFGTKPSPYEMALPSGLPRYCMLPN